MICERAIVDYNGPAGREFSEYCHGVGAMLEPRESGRGLPADSETQRAPRARVLVSRWYDASRQARPRKYVTVHYNLSSRP